MHLVEEVQHGFRQKFPLGEMPKPIFIGINIILYAFCFATFLLSIRSSSLAIPFTWILAIAMLMNGAGHIGIMSVRRRYFHGG
jgi:hypothetical protein